MSDIKVDIITDLAGTGEPDLTQGVQIKGVSSEAFTLVEKTKLGLIENLATTDQTGAEIKTLYEAEAKAFTDTQFDKLGLIEDLADVTDATNVAAAGAVMEADTTTTAMAFVLDEDDMVSDSDTQLATQQSIKAYVDASGGPSFTHVTVGDASYTAAAFESVVFDTPLTADVCLILPAGVAGDRIRVMDHGANTSSGNRIFIDNVMFPAVGTATFDGSLGSLSIIRDYDIIELLCITPDNWQIVIDKEIGVVAGPNYRAIISKNIGSAVDGVANNNGVAIGDAAIAGGARGIAIGDRAEQIGPTQGGIAIGRETAATGTGVAIGWGNIADTNGTAVGYGASAGTAGVSIGQGAAAANSAVSIGSSSAASSATSTAVGTGANAAARATALGQNADASADQNIAIGAEADASGASGAIAIGYDANATHTNSIVIGRQATSFADNQILLGAVGVNPRVYIPGTLTYIGAGNTPGQVLTALAADGVATWEDPASGFSWNYVTADGTATVVAVASDQIVFDTALVATVKVELPAGVAGDRIRILDYAAASSNFDITIDNATDDAFFDGVQATAIIDTDLEMAELLCITPNNWYVVK